LNKHLIYCITIIILLIFVLRLSFCDSPNPPKPNNHRDTVISVEWDTLTVEVPKYVPQWRTKYNFIHDTLLDKVDTASILKDYFATYSYIDTVGNDTIKAIINENVSQNKISSREVKFNLLYPTVTKIVTVTKNNRQLYIGLGINGTKELNILGVGPELAYKTKNGYLFGIGANILGSAAPNYNIRIYRKIGKK